ncbi:hypothetical protein CDIMF43_280201 [Carnobacterium divergens]|nr:hypothetical protein CDIV41_140207 [Carnobacterium divergens]SPC41307.1 hypothetical protein CDIMF43_280201 [Carnobacterium divergens]
MSFLVLYESYVLIEKSHKTIVNDFDYKLINHSVLVDFSKDLRQRN